LHTPPILTDLVVLLFVSLPVAYLCLRLKLPVLVGFMLTGILIGPSVFALISEREAIELLAEIGVMFLLFSIGIEFSLRRLLEMRKLVFIGGGLQVGITILATAGISTLFGRSISQSIFFGFLIALSSTAIVLKSYVDRNEVDSPHGKTGIGILLFQDICVVPMMLLIPILGKGEGETLEVLSELGISLLALVVILGLSYFFVPKIFTVIGKLRSPEMFVLTIVFLFLGISFATSQFGLSLALGAFIAGAVISESDFSHQVAAEILPFRDVFNSIFFVSIGLLLSFGALIANFGTVIALVGALVIGKLVLIWMVARLLGFPQRIAAMSALGLAQVGEFSFILAKAGQSNGLLIETEYQTFLGASIISMIATPFMISFAPKFGTLVQKMLKDPTVENESSTEEDIHVTSSGGLRNHVIIVGYGLNGRNLARVLRAVSLPYTVLELNMESVRRARADGEKINFGDSTRAEVLKHAGIEDAYAVVVATSDPFGARMTVSRVREMNDKVHIIVRTKYTSEINELLDLGANEVIPEEFETSIEIFSRVLQRYGIGRHVIEGEINKIRSQGYEMLRSSSLPQARIAKLDKALKAAETESICVPPNSPIAGKTLGDLRLRTVSGTTVIAITRGNETEINPGIEYVIQPEDLLLLVGTAENLDRAIALINGSSESN
jgi:monovalent cation:H+ antiporter-2, CPA2 family